MNDQQIIDVYAARKMTIREIAKASGRSYADVRKVLTFAGYHFSKKQSGPGWGLVPTAISIRD